MIFTAQKMFDLWRHACYCQSRLLNHPFTDVHVSSMQVCALGITTRLNVWESLMTLLTSIYIVGVFYFGKYSYRADSLKQYSIIQSFMFEVACRFRSILFYIWIWPYLKREGYIPLCPIPGFISTVDSL